MLHAEEESGSISLLHRARYPCLANVSSMLVLSSRKYDEIRFNYFALRNVISNNVEGLWFFRRGDFSHGAIRARGAASLRNFSSHCIVSDPTSDGRLA